MTAPTDVPRETFDDGPLARDMIDVTILRLRESRVSYRAIADQVGLSHEAVRNRYHRMLSAAAPIEEVDLLRREENELLDRLTSEALGVITGRELRDPDGQLVPAETPTADRPRGTTSVYIHDAQTRLSGIRTARLVSRSRAALNGLDAPKRIEVEGLMTESLSQYFDGEIARIQAHANDGADVPRETL